MYERGLTLNNSRTYKSSFWKRPHSRSTKAKKVLQQREIILLASKDCCSKNCAQTISLEKMKLLRERMYVGTTFQFQTHLKLEVHRQSRTQCKDRKVVTVEGIDVYHEAWRHIMVDPESMLYRYAKSSARNEVAQIHSNFSLYKPRLHTLQATTTLRCILKKSTDHMPDRSRILASGEKVVAKVLPPSWR